MNIADFIPVGKENAISRNQLVISTGLSDRIVRDMIALERRNTAILNLQNGAGYYIPSASEKADLKRYIKQEESRAKSIFWSLRGAKTALRKCGNG